MSKKHFKLFYSWQSEDTKSRKALDNALKEAVDALKLKGIKLQIDHSTLGESGMPSIDQTILRKIDACDIFLADITPVCNYQSKMGNGQQITKEVPNPNVLIELGYAMSALGVGYVIVAAHQGKWLPANLPFDINHHALYCFASKTCNLTSHIIGVIEYIEKNGSHRHVDKPYLLNKMEQIIERLKPEDKSAEHVIYEESTVFFKRRMCNAFPGYRGLRTFTKQKDICRHLSKLLEPPIRFDYSAIGTKDPIWWFRAGSAMEIPSFKYLGGRKFLIGWDEFVIKKIVAYIDSGRYYSNYVYVETQAEKPTKLNKDNYTPEKLEELKEIFKNDVDEEYAIYKPCVFFRKMVTKQEEDDGSTKIFGRLVKMKREHVETRIRHLSNYNFIIAAKDSAFNNNTFDSTSEFYFMGLLDDTVTMEEFNEYMMKFPKPDYDF